MALIGSIRKNGWILIVLMTLALGGFILMEIITYAQRNSSGDVNTLGKVNGREIKRSDFETYQELVYSNAKGNSYQVRNQIWTYFVEEALVKDEAEALGLGVGKDELMELQFGNNISPVIAERFKGPDGQVNRQTLAGIKNAIESGQFTDPKNRAYWAVQEKEVVKERLEQKITNLVLKGLFTPSWQAELVFKENNERLDFKFVRIPYDKVADNEIQVTDADYKAYLKDFPKLYDQPEEARTLSYVAIDVVPTAADSATARTSVEKMAEGLRTAVSDSAYVEANEGTYDPSYKRKDALPIAIADTLLKLPLGTVVGPYLDGGIWGVAKILDRKVVPDSVKARHILVRGGDKPSENKIDSLRNLLTAGKASFDSLAVQNSEDKGSGAKGGDLGYMEEGKTVPEFNAVLFFTGKKGPYYKVKTQFGWHLIEILDQKFIKNENSVKAVYLSQRIVPGKATQSAAKDRAVVLVQDAKTIDQLTTIAGQQNLRVESTAPLKENDYSLGASGGEDARDIVRWAYEDKTKVGNVSKEVFSFRDPNGGYFDHRYLVVALKSITPKGKATVEALKANPRVETEVKNRKKAEVIKSKIPSGLDLPAVASQFGVQTDTARNVTMLQAFIPNGGNEPRVVGTVFATAKDAIGGPVAGNSGVFLVQPISEKPNPAMPADLTLFKRQVTSSVSTQVRVNLLNSLKKQSDLEDFRSRFF